MTSVKIITSYISRVNNSAKFQYLATIAANLLIIGYGTSCGWPSISFATLQSEQTPLDDGPLTTTEISWIVSMFCIGGFFGTIVFGLITNLVGRKTFLLLLAVPQILSWTLVIWAKNVYYLYIARLLVGIAGGGAYLFVPLLVAEIAEDRVRGQLGTLVMVSRSFGILLIFIADNFLSYQTIILYLTAIPVVFLSVFGFFPESPQYLMLKSEPTKAEHSLKLYRNCRLASRSESEFYQHELQKFQTNCRLVGQSTDSNTNRDKLTFGDFVSRPALKAFLISLTIFTMNECSGAFVMINYTAAIFADAGSSIPPEWSAILVALLQLSGTYVSTILIDRLGRRPLLIFSSVSGGLSLVGLGTYTYSKQLGGWDLESVSWMPVVTFASLEFVASCGTIPIAFLITTEVMPAKIRGVGTSICLSYSWLLAFVLLKYFPICSEAFGLHVCMAFFAIVTFCGTLFVIFVMPETKGKSFEEIQLELER